MDAFTEGEFTFPQLCHGLFINRFRNYSKKNKTFPSLQVKNVPPEVDKVRIRVALYTNEIPRNHHVHKVGVFCC